MLLSCHLLGNQFLNEVVCRYPQLSERLAAGWGSCKTWFFWICNNCQWKFSLNEGFWECLFLWIDVSDRHTDHAYLFCILFSEKLMCDCALPLLYTQWRGQVFCPDYGHVWATCSPREHPWPMSGTRIEMIMLFYILLCQHQHMVPFVSATLTKYAWVVSMLAF